MSRRKVPLFLSSDDTDLLLDALRLYHGGLGYAVAIRADLLIEQLTEIQFAQRYYPTKENRNGPRIGPQETEG